ncbi:STAS domain-containing protein [Rhodanobacter aciditrophus]|uniref:STAS domain-containing protein n=1 Tax=Rhodanobacter aciditrophus TaxID=1623218 RepID=A0ABW4B059_9GAMM
MINSVMIPLPEKFTFDSYTWFEEQCAQVIADSGKVELVCNRVSYLDSAALGMIAYLHKRMDALGKGKIVVREPSSYCEDIFRSANMYQHYIEAAPNR